mgnify:CR=1 FL=1
MNAVVVFITLFLAPDSSNYRDVSVLVYKDWKSCKAQLEKIEANLLSNEDEYVVKKIERRTEVGHTSAIVLDTLNKKLGLMKKHECRSSVMFGD